MEILAFLIVLCNLVLVLWGFGFFSRSPSNQKHQPRSRASQQPPLKIPESQKRDTTITKTTPPGALVQNKTISLSSRRVAPRRSVVSKKAQTRPRSSKHQRNIQRADLLLQQLRGGATEVQLPMAIAMLRRINPYAFEELLLTCCEEQGWQIQRNFRYSGDGGVDGRVVIAGKLYLIQREFRLSCMGQSKL